MKSKITQIKLNILSMFISLGFGFQIPLTKFININEPDMKKSFIVAIWHAHQCALYGFRNVIDRVNILISPSNDGQIITDACSRLGYKIIRGSKGREGTSKAIINMLDALNNGEIVAITVDGPRGPNHVVKKGVVELAKLSGKPIIPMIWYSPNKNFLRFNSWDEFTIPFGYCKVMNLYGEPIYVDRNTSDEEFEQKRLEVQQKLEELYKDAVENYVRYLKNTKYDL